MRIILTKILLSIAILFSTANISMAQTTNAPLPAEQAFVLSTSVISPTEIAIHWQIAQGYYLYAKRTNITLHSANQINIKFPQGDLKYDPNFGRQEVFSGNVNVPVTFTTQHQQLPLTIEYQGCSEDGFCYPPMQKKLKVDLANLSIAEEKPSLSSASAPLLHLLSDHQGVASLLSNQPLSLLLFMFGGLGLLLAFTPCILPMVPILAGIIVGQRQPVSTKKAFLLSLSYVLGSSVTYAFAGLLAASLGSTLQAWLQQPLIILLVSALFVLLSFSLFDLFQLQLPSGLQNHFVNFSNRQRSGNYLGVFVMGTISTLIISPCVTAPLVGVLIYISQTGDKILGASALFTMGLGMGIPLLLIGTSAGRWLPKRGPWMEAIKKIVGFFMLAMAIWLLGRVLPNHLMQILWGLFLIGLAIFIAIYLPKFIKLKGLNRVLGLTVALFGFFILFSSVNKVTEKQIDFKVVHHLAEINTALTAAQLAQQPVLLDFYADWCEACILMDKAVFQQPEVKQALKGYVLLRADLTDNSSEDQAIMQHFKVIAPPTVLFFAKDGQVLMDKQLIGEVDAKTFLAKLSAI